MSRRVLYFSLLALSLTACGSVNNKQATGEFDYADKPESKPLVVPAGLDKPVHQAEFHVTDKVNQLGALVKFWLFPISSMQQQSGIAQALLRWV
jgi:outer membrane protein assembly factor BamC